MADYKLAEGLYLYPTPAGAYYAVSSSDEDRTRKFLRNLLKQSKSPELNERNLLSLMGFDDIQKSYELLHHCQQLGLVQGLDHPLDAPAGALEKILPEILGNISENGKVLLSDHQGFYLVCEGFAHETAEELSALSADISSVHERRLGLLFNNMGLKSHAWGIIDAAGNSHVGFWPLFIDDNRFIVVIAGVPHFNRPAFVDLVWALFIRYGSNVK